MLGPSFWLDAPGVVLEAPAPHGHDDALLRAWGGRVAWMCAAVGWTDNALAIRRHARGSTLAFTAPPAALMAATAINEWALRSAAEELGIPYDVAQLEDDRLPLDQSAALEDLRARIAAEEREPPPDAAPIADRPIPIALVTGSNGKTTTTRLLAAMLRAHGHVVGYSCTDGVFIGGESVEAGDWSGPGGARRVLEDARVTAAVLETARGGLLRRGLVVTRADVAVVTNAAADHFGEYGIDTIADLAALKSTVAHALGTRGTLVLNADDPLLNPDSPSAALAPVARAVPVERLRTFSLRHPWPEWLPPAMQMPITAAGTAQFNMANVLAAATAARALGLPDTVIAETLRHFGDDPHDNSGRLMRMALGGITVIVDYAHNPHGLAALLATSRALASGRLLLLLGQAGDRDDDAIRELARTAWDARPDLIVLRDVTGYLRGREAGAVPALLAATLRAQGAPRERLLTELDEHAAARLLLAHARRGDLLVMPVHALESRAAFLHLLNGLRAAGWTAGDALP